MIILFKYCADVENCGSFKDFGFIYNLNKMIILFKYCADVENCESFKGFGFIYIYRLFYEKNLLLYL